MNLMTVFLHGLRLFRYRFRSKSKKSKLRAIEHPHAAGH